MTGEADGSQHVADVIKAEIRSLDLEAGSIEVGLALAAPMHMDQPTGALVLRFDDKIAHDLVVQLSRVLWQSEPRSVEPWDPWHEGP